MSSVEALNANDITKIGVIVIIGLVVAGVLLSLVITAVIGRLVILAVVIVAGIFVWQQRTHIKDEVNANKCNLHATFFGIHLAVPDSVRQACNARSS